MRINFIEKIKELIKKRVLEWCEENGKIKQEAFDKLAFDELQARLINVINEKKQRYYSLSYNADVRTINEIEADIYNTVQEFKREHLNK